VAADRDPEQPPVTSVPPVAPEPTASASADDRAATEVAARSVAFVDSSALVALVDRDDASHEAAAGAYRDLVGAGYRLFTTNYVVAETFDLLRAGPGIEIAQRWLRDSRLAVFHVDEQDEAKARKMALAPSSGRNLSLTDAISLVVMDRLGVNDAFAVDQRFLAETA
jgi:predicted nucleic acid-binding protein